MCFALQICLAAEKCGSLRFDVRNDMWYSSVGFLCDVSQADHVTYWSLLKKVHTGMLLFLASFTACLICGTLPVGCQCALYLMHFGAWNVLSAALLDPSLLPVSCLLCFLLCVHRTASVPNFPAVCAATLSSSCS